MSELKKTMELDKAILVEKIREQFMKIDQLKYQRKLFEFFDNQGKFLGDNVFETTFKQREGDAPLVYEVSGPYDVVSKEYATIARVYLRGELKFECDMKLGIFQRTAAMVWLYLATLDHTLGKTLFIGAGKVARNTAAYLKFFSPELGSVDYTDLTQKVDTFEKPLQIIGIQTRYLDNPDFSGYNTIIMATNTTKCIIDDGNISTLKPGTVIVSVCTTSQSGEVSKEIYARSDINTFLDYDLSKTFTEDMRKANDLGYLDKVIYFKDILSGQSEFDLGTKVNIVRLTGTPIQNVAVIDTMLKEENLDL
jgi:hypothetical protein